MPDYQIKDLKIHASYNQINPTPNLSMRANPGRISELVMQQLSETIDLEAVYETLKDTLFTSATGKAAVYQATDAVLAEMNNQAPEGTDLTLYNDPVYRKTSTGTHETINYVLKSEGGGTAEPWPFTIEINGYLIEGFVCLSVLVVELVAMQSSDGDAIRSQRSVPQKHVGHPGPATASPTTWSEPVAGQGKKR